MRHLRLVPVLAALLWLPPTLHAGDAQAAVMPAVVPVNKVVLFTSGVGYFQHAGTVAGNAEAELRVKSAQIDDLLKSLILQDLDGGNIGSVVYPAQDPIDKTLRSFQINLTGNPGLADLANQLRGAAVTVDLGAEKLSGTIIGAEKRVSMTSERTVTEVWLLNLLSAGAMRQVPMSDVRALTPTEPQLQQEFAKALAALAQARDQDKKPVTLHFDGAGVRRVQFGYVVETPVWKTSYRLVLPAKAGDPGALQGWALIDNQTDWDWNGVDLALVSGRPVSFTMNLYQPLYAPRPRVDLELFAGLRPQVYGGEMMDDFAGKAAAGAQSRTTTFGAHKRALNGLTGIIAGQPSAVSASLADEKDYDGQPGKPAVLDPTASIQAAATTEKLGEIFQYTVPNVTLPRQHSAMLPIVTDPIQVERVSIYNAAAPGGHPLLGALVTNTTGKQLPAGPLTVFDAGSYAGDAQIDHLPPTQHRLLSFAIDIPMLVDASSASDERQVASGKIVQGVLTLQTKLIATRTYRISNGAETERTLIVEHPARANWTLVGTEPFERTPGVYRFKVAVPAGKPASLDVREEYVQAETVGLVDLDLDALSQFSTTGQFTPKVREALVKAAGLRAQLHDLKNQGEAKTQQLAAITADQNRLRENLRSVQQNSEYGTRLLKKLNVQETQVDGLQTEIEQLHDAGAKKSAELNTYLAGLTIE